MIGAEGDGTLGVLPYAERGYCRLDYVPQFSDVRTAIRITQQPGVPPEEAGRGRRQLAPQLNPQPHRHYPSRKRGWRLSTIVMVAATCTINCAGCRNHTLLTQSLAPELVRGK